MSVPKEQGSMLMEYVIVVLIVLLGGSLAMGEAVFESDRNGRSFRFGRESFRIIRQLCGGLVPPFDVDGGATVPVKK